MKKKKNIRLKVSTSQAQVDQLTKRFTTLFAEVETLVNVAKKIDGDINVSSLRDIPNLITTNLENRFPTDGILPEKVAALLGLEKYYNTIIQDTPILLESSGYRRFGNFLQYNKKENNYGYDESDLMDYIDGLSSTFLTTEKEIELFHFAERLVELYSEIEKYTGDTTENLRNRKKFGDAHKLLFCDVQSNGWAIKPNISQIQQLAKLI